ncbi:MAG: LGFP repeat-containing protein [Thermoleophilia bacterium]
MTHRLRLPASAAALTCAVILAVFLMLVATPDGRGAETVTPWLDDSKPIASFLFTDEEMLGRLQSDLGLAPAQTDAVRTAGRKEAASLAALKKESETVVGRTDLAIEQKQSAVKEMQYNERLRGAVSTARVEIETALDTGQRAQLASWVAARMGEQRQQFVAAATTAAMGTTGAAGAAGGAATAATGGGYRIYATQYHSNYGPGSVDVAVPDKYVKFASLGWEYHSGYPAGGNYSVNLSLNGRQLNGIQVKDCGPWNIDDNYWNTAGGARPRRLFAGLATGLPEAQAAYFDGYNGGKDQFGRTISNPAGIDLSPQAGVQLGLGYLVSGWIYVNFNWETPAIPIVGAVLGRYNQLDGAPGEPRSAEYDVPGGRAQDFTNGRLFWNRASGQVTWVRGAILGKYDQMGGPGGLLGLPVSDELDVSGGRASYFQGGRVYWSMATDVHPVVGGILARYLLQGGPDRLGLPASDEYDVLGGRALDLHGSRIFWSMTTDAHVVTGAILGKYDLVGGPGALGMPTTEEIDTAGRTGGRVSNFQRGSIYWSTATEAHAVVGGIFARYRIAGGPGTLGLPTGDEADVNGKPGARVSTFERGRVYWSMTTDAHALQGGILTKYDRLGGPAVLGLPLSDESDVPGKPGARVSVLQRGRIYWSMATDAYHVVGGIMGRFDQLGGPSGIMGLPTTDEFDIPAGRRSNFQGGYITWEQATGMVRTVYN